MSDEEERRLDKMTLKSVGDTDTLIEQDRKDEEETKRLQSLFMEKWVADQKVIDSLERGDIKKDD